MNGAAAKAIDRGVEYENASWVQPSRPSRGNNRQALRDFPDS